MRIVVGALVAVLLALLAWPGPGWAAPPSEDELAAPAVGAQAVAVVDVDSGGLLYGVNAHEHRAQASLTKMMTALVAVEHWKLDDPIVATKRSLVEPAVIGMEPGDRLPLRDALYGLLLNSGNDAALAIAETVGEGSISRFVGWMNLDAVRLGLKDTHFVNPHGLDAEDHYSSAYDVALLGRALLKDRFLAEVVATPRYVVPGPPEWVFHNLNPLLGKVDGVDGLKTGYETNAGHCLAVSATREGHQLIVVVMDDDDYARDSAALVEWGFATFRWWQVRVPSPQTGRIEPTTIVLREDQARSLPVLAEMARRGA